MSKKQTQRLKVSLPSTSTPPEVVVGQKDDPVKPKPKPIKRESVVNVVISLQWSGELVETGDYLRIDVRPLTRKQKQGLAVLLGCVGTNNDRLENGTLIRRPSHAVKYTLEMIADASDGLTAEK